MRLTLASFTAAALLAGLSVPVDAGAGLAAPPAGDEVIAYGDTGGGERTLRLVTAATGQPVGTFAEDGAAYVEPAFSPQDSRLAFALRAKGRSWHDLYVVSSDGERLRRLTVGPKDARQPAWSPVAPTIAFVRIDPIKGTSQIMRIGAGGGNLQTVTGRRRGRFDATPAWNPDGSAVVFARGSRSRFPRLFVRSVSPDGPASGSLTEGTCSDANPAWSAAGIVFDRTCPGQLPDLWIVQPDGTGLMNLTSTPGVAEFDAAWSPDGDALAFATHTDASGDANIARSSLDPWAPVPVVASSASELGPDWHRLPASTSLCSPAADPGTEGPCRLGVEEALEGDADVPLDSAPEMDEGGDSARTTSVAVAPGITYRRIRDRRRRQRIFVLTINMSAGPRIGTALARETLPDFERTTTMAKGNGAFAAVNGDFGLPSGRPAHDFAAEGDLKQTSRAYGYHFGPAADGSKASTGHRVVTLESVVARGERWFASRWNDGAPTVGQIAAFSPVARSLERAPAFACSVRVSSALTRDWAAGKQGVESEHTVVAGGCDATSRQAAGGIVLSARAFSEEASFLRGLVLGDSITLRWSIGWDGVSDTLGGYPQLVRNGRILVGNCSQSLCRRHPRTGVGIRSDGRILLVVVDGRRKQARGMTLRAFARRLKKLGAVRALNLDGGGSSTMWIRGKGIVNRPSDGRERYVSSALLVYKTADQNLARSPAASGPGPIPAERTPASAGRIVVEDPASTGGFLDALESGVLTAPVELPADLLKVVRRFRAANRAFG